MADTLLVLVIALLTVNLLFVGVYIVLVLKEVRSAVIKMNEVMDSISAITAAVATPVVGAAGAVTAFTQGLKAYKKLKGIHNRAVKSTGSRVRTDER